jgi:ferrous iron transport protein B
MSAPFKIAIAGNPNSGKTSLFNALTGLRQKVGNFPGVTVDRKTGLMRLPGHPPAHITDLPGTYSLYPHAADERVAWEVLVNPRHPDHPDLVIVVVDASSLERNLLFCSQVADLQLPVVIALTMTDIARKKGITVDCTELQRLTGIPVAEVNPRRHLGIAALKARIVAMRDRKEVGSADFAAALPPADWTTAVKQISGVTSGYGAVQVACNHKESAWLDMQQQQELETVLTKHGFQKSALQAKEITERYRRIHSVTAACVRTGTPEDAIRLNDRIDKILLHPIWGNLILLLVLLFMFQSIFWLAQYPMDWIDRGFGMLSGALEAALPPGLLSDLIVNGLLAGIGGVVIFVPQIMILFGLITILEDTGYMARISFLSDRAMRSAGLNGRSVMPLISGLACAIPAVMAARSVRGSRERLITIMVTPLMSCAARLPVYTILISLVIPQRTVLGFLSLQGLVLTAMYLLGGVMALLAARVMDFFIKKKEAGSFIMELPVYREPRWNNVLTAMFEKARIFVTDAGKVILVISLILWSLASFGPPGRMRAVEEKYTALRQQHPAETEQLNRQEQSEKLEQSFAGILGHAIEPAIRPLGYDWKIGIAIITSFAAREVFVGTMATLHSVEDGSSATVREKMRAARRPDGTPVYTLATGVSLLLFYAFALQCMSTVAIVRRETGSWKYPLTQFVGMLLLACLSAWFAYTWIS